MFSQIEIAAATLAESEQFLQEAKVVEAGSRLALSDIEAKIGAVRSRKAKIRSDLEAGAITEAQAGGLFQIACADETDLGDIIRTASEQLARAVAVTRDVQTGRDRAIRELERAERQQTFDTLAVRVAAIEETFTNALGELYALGAVLGLPRALSAVWRPSEQLHRAVAWGVPPTKVPS